MSNTGSNFYPANAGSGCGCGSGQPTMQCCGQSNWINPSNIGELKYIQGRDAQGCPKYQCIDDLNIPLDLCNTIVPAATINAVLGIDPETGCIRQMSATEFVQSNQAYTEIFPIGPITSVQDPVNPALWTVGIDLCKVLTEIDEGVIEKVAGFAGECLIWQDPKDFVELNKPAITITAGSGISITGVTDEGYTLTVGVDLCDLGKDVPAGTLDYYLGIDANNCIKKAVLDPKTIFCEALSCLEVGDPESAAAQLYLGSDCQLYPMPEIPTLCEELAEIPAQEIEATFGSTFILDASNCRKIKLPSLPPINTAAPITGDGYGTPLGLDTSGVCDWLTASVPDGEMGISGTTRVLGKDCTWITLPAQNFGAENGPITVDPVTGEIIFDWCAAGNSLEDGTLPEDGQILGIDAAGCIKKVDVPKTFEACTDGENCLVQDPVTGCWSVAPIQVDTTASCDCPSFEKATNTLFIPQPVSAFTSVAEPASGVGTNNTIIMPFTYQPLAGDLFGGGNDFETVGGMLSNDAAGTITVPCTQPYTIEAQAGTESLSDTTEFLLTNIYVNGVNIGQPTPAVGTELLANVVSSYSLPQFCLEAGSTVTLGVTSNILATISSAFLTLTSEANCVECTPIIPV